ncbi:VOC family protein [Mesorhizobium muleiense]|jgi:catechol-2,3-dioxygenase|uniref:VOC family protein n=1 Tax=Mesorhizobium muleiense TaxID=1004279 RepID=UPI001F18188A|nr:VOC family protein [Mesorhizobium muleiense]MCF6114995.1 VOC family protein [Mesorhizobium muleiense]
MTTKHFRNGGIAVDRSDPAIVTEDKTGRATAPRIVGLRHVGMVAENPAALARFYEDVLGLQVVGGSGEENPFGATAFLSSDPAEESHQIAIFTNPALRHIAFKVGTLADLRAAYTRIIDMGLPIKMAFNHGVSLAFYFDDPEGNLVEVYWATGMAFDQPYGDPLDLALPEEALRQEVEQLVRQASEQTPQSLPVASAS